MFRPSKSAHVSSGAQAPSWPWWLPHPYQRIPPSHVRQIQRLSPWRASGVPSWLYRSFQEYLGGAKPSPDSVDLPGWAFIACCAAISSFTYSVGLANRPPCWTALSRMNSTPSAYLLGHSASLAPEVASGGKPDQMGNSPYAASQKAASGSAPRRRESSVEEESTRRVVD